MIREGGTIADLNKLGEQYKDKVLALRSFEQVLNEQLGYQTISIGKWHVPATFAYGKTTKGRVIAYNEYDFAQNQPDFSNVFNWKIIYRRAKDYLLKRDGKGNFCNVYKKGQQENL